MRQRSAGERLPSATGALPEAVSAFVLAAGRLAAAAVDRGDRAEARRLLETALMAVDAGASAPVLRVVGAGR